MDNVRSTPPSWATSRARRAGELCKFNWVPSHIGAVATRRPMKAAREATRHSGGLDCLTKLQGAKYCPDYALPSVPHNNSIASWVQTIEAGLAQTSHEKQRAITPRPAASRAEGSFYPTSAWLRNPGLSEGRV
ncbi:hypothetical protein GWK47_003121 [Chionoecetes opilio]|uniref:Uncharacterized protein n=1 Tax=Chionoecetes opilio TaxID=41210 RepID=A0A8J8WEF9_CHIOP|nr:hypothetical protein GWK47_003121 [Chionoecetes opilio]